MLPGGRDEALRRQVVDLVGLDLVDDGEERRLVEKVRAKELDAVAEVLDATTGVRTGAACDTDDPVAKVEEVLGQIAAVLTGDAGDERRSRIHAPVIPSPGYPAVGVEQTRQGLIHGEVAALAWDQASVAGANRTPHRGREG